MLGHNYVPTCSDIVKSMILRRKVVENIRKVSNRCILSIKWPFVYSVCGRLMGSIAETLCINPEQKIFSFDSVLPSESCLRAPLPPKTCRKKFQIFFLGPHWNSLTESNLSWGLMEIEENHVRSSSGGGNVHSPHLRIALPTSFKKLLLSNSLLRFFGTPQCTFAFNFPLQ